MLGLLVGVVAVVAQYSLVAGRFGDVRRWSRREWLIALAAALLSIALGVGAYLLQR